MEKRSAVEANLQGVAVPRRFSGTVLSVHRSVLNLQGDERLLVSLVSNSEDMTDRAIRVPPRLFELSIAPGTPVDGNVNRLRLGESATILRHWAAPWSGRLRRATRPGEGVSERELHRRLQAVRETLLAADPGYGALGLLSPSLGGDAFSRAIGARLGRWDFASLVGLGIGFTPSGDDVLSGISLYLAIIRLIRPFTKAECALSTGLRSVSGGSAGPGAGDGSSPGAGDYLGRTTAGGATLLSLTLHGSFPAYQLRFATALLGPGPFDPGREVTALKSHGESSGFDMATGLLWAAENCRK